MKTLRIAKTLVAMAAVAACMGAWADLTYNTAGTVTFDSMNDSPGKVFVGNSDETTFASDWVVFRSFDGTTNYGFTGATQFQVGSTDGHDAKLGRLKIESGYYGANVVWKNLIGYKGTGYVWLTGGYLDITNNLCAGVGGAGSVGYLNIDGGKVAISTDLNLPRDNNSEGHAAVTNGELAVSGNLIVCDGNNSVGALSVGSGATVTANKFWVARSSGSTAVLEVGGGTISVNGEFNIANYGGNGTFLMTGGTIATKGASYWGTDTGSTSTAEISGGSLMLGDGNDEFTILNNANSTCTITVNGGEVVSDGDVKFGNGGTTEGPGSATLTISNGGYFGCGTETRAKWFKFGEGGAGCTRTINIDEGGVLGVWHFENYENGTTTINFNGGTLKALGTDSNNNKYILGSKDHADNSVSVFVNAGGGTIDTNGKKLMIKNVALGGTGTLEIVGGGTVTFETNPTCPVKVVEGTTVMFAGDATPPSNIELAVGGFIEYDLSSITESGVTTNLATNVTITVPAGDEVGEHVIIRNGGVFWNVAYSGTTLSATSTSDTTALAGGYTIWTGYYDGNTPTDQIKSWVNGFPGAPTKVIVPRKSTLKLYWSNSRGNVLCGDVILHGDLTLYSSNNKWQNFRPRSITGTGTIYLGFSNGYGYFESHLDAGSAEVNAPVVVHANSPIVSGSANYPLNFNKSFTVNSGAIVDHNSDNNNVNYNDDLIVNGTLKLNGKVPALQKAIAGAGKINGSFTTADGAKICATVTNENATAECLTVTGTADLANATVEIAGGALPQTA